jgi:hypothetical protein
MVSESYVPTEFEAETLAMTKGRSTVYDSALADYSNQLVVRKSGADVASVMNSTGK